MDIICKAEQCTGCAACMNRCPKKCIEMPLLSRLEIIGPEKARI